MRLARQRNIPAYVVFSDRTLRELAAQKPLTLAAFSAVYGVGEEKLKHYAKAFIAVIAAQAGFGQAV